MRVIGVIPARYGSTRLKAKPLTPICGKPLVQWVWEAASRTTILDEVLVATDDERIQDLIESFAGIAVMTPVECPSGTDRVHAAVLDRECDIVVNIQGDEPLMRAENIDACVRALANDPEAAVSTPMIPLQQMHDFESPDVVKVVVDSRGYALYFSRSPLPSFARLDDAERKQALPGCMKHLGLYVYRRDALEAFVKMPPSRYEQIEKLEQLRFLEAGFRIKMVEVRHDSVGVDTMKDVMAVEKVLKER
jgi:3-deoxy-manno-octulosonate cytidylyltransferase (CMP-KDO synthetase)